MEPTSVVYCPSSQRVDDEQRCRELLAQEQAALWITGTDGAPTVTLLPTVWEGNRLISHASGHNQQFQLPDGEPVACRVLVQGPHTYVSPQWYPTTAPDTGRTAGRAVGTWDYSQVQLAGWLRVHRDVERLRDEVLRLGTDYDAPVAGWTPDLMPSSFQEAMLRGIVGLELEITEVVGRFKLSQNRVPADRDGVVTGLETRGRDRDLAVARAVRETPGLSER